MITKLLNKGLASPLVYTKDFLRLFYNDLERILSEIKDHRDLESKVRFGLFEHTLPLKIVIYLLQ